MISSAPPKARCAESMLVSAQPLGARSKAASPPFTEPIELSVEHHLEWLTNQLSTLGQEQTISTEPWFGEQPSTDAQQGLVLALLELAQRGSVILHQAEHLGPIVAEVANRESHPFPPRPHFRFMCGNETRAGLGGVYGSIAPARSQPVAEHHSSLRAHGPNAAHKALSGGLRWQ